MASTVFVVSALNSEAEAFVLQMKDLFLYGKLSFGVRIELARMGSVTLEIPKNVLLGRIDYDHDRGEVLYYVEAGDKLVLTRKKNFFFNDLSVMALSEKKNADVCPKKVYDNPYGENEILAYHTDFDLSRWPNAVFIQTTRAPRIEDAIGALFAA